MNARVHLWIVCDAVAYIKRHGDDVEKKALQTFQAAYGEPRPVEDIPPGKSAVERLAGFEAWHTDKFGDLALRIPNLPWGGKHNLVGLAGHMFTAFNHFINPYPGMADSWATTNGYSYSISSQQGFDSAVVGGISEYFRGQVDEENSLVLDRIRPYWKKGDTEWTENLQEQLRNTTFAPWSVLVQIYYACLLRHHFEPLEVRGPNKYIVGLQFLGPIFHAAADASSPQHVRPSLGLGHQVWENYVQARVYNRTLDLNPELVHHMLQQEPFEPWLRSSEPPMEGRFDVETFVQRLSVKTAERLRQSWAAGSWDEIRQAGQEFWSRYLTGAAMMTDAHYLYNQAVAGAVHIIARSYADLVNFGILDPDKGLADTAKLPDMDLVQDDLPEAPLKRAGMEDVPPEATRPIPFSEARDILGFEPFGQPGLNSSMKELARMCDPFVASEPAEPNVSYLFTDLEDSLLQQYNRKAEQTGGDFCPVRAVGSIPLDSDMSAHFGTASFRLPSEVECNDPVMLERYMRQVDGHAKKAYALQLTQAVGALRFYMAQHREEGAAAEKAEQLMHALRRRRLALTLGVDESLIFDTYAPVEVVRQEAKAAPTRAIAPESPSLLERVRDWLSPLFQVPVMTLATVAAAVLVLVIVWPRGVPEEIVALSTTKWAEPTFTLMGPRPSPKPKIMPPAERPKLAMVVTFRNLEGPLDQNLVDSVYSSIQPTEPMKQRFDIIPPNEIKEAVTKGEVQVAPTNEFIKGLNTQLQVSKVLMLNIVAQDSRYGLEGDYKDLNTGESRKIKMEKEVNAAELPSAVRKSVLFFFQE